MMKNKYAILVLLLTLASVGCKQEQAPKVIYTQQELELDQDKDKEYPEIQEEVSSSYLLADLPIVFGDSGYLIHPVGQVRSYNQGSKYSSKKQHYSFTISSYVPFELTGALENLMFQHVDSLSISPLSSSLINIESVTYLNELAQNTNQHVLVYRLSDQDTNLDGVIDQADIKSLYLSLCNGKDFTKLTPDMLEVLDWSFVSQNNRLYFRCIKDVNKNGAFDKMDSVHYYYVDLLQKPWQSQSYSPFEVLEEDQENF